MPTSASTRYTIAGALFGAGFPVVATALLLLQRGQGFGLDQVLAVQASERLLWIIDTAPVWLALFARLGGRKQDEVDAYAHTLEERVAARTAALAEERRRAEAACVEARRRAEEAQAALEALEASREAERRAGERARHLARHIEALPSPLVEVDARGRVVFANRAFWALVRAAPRDGDAPLLDSLLSFEGEDPVARTVREARPVVTDAGVRAGGAEMAVPVRCATSPVRDAGGAITGALVVLLDQSAVARETARLHEAAAEVDATAGELARRAASLLGGLQAIEEATRDTGVSIESLVDQARIAAHGAEELEHLARGLARHGREVAAATAEARAQVERARGTSTAVVDLSREAAGQAAEIAAIARQTRLLALNATIRAADRRGGDRGFEAVAHEVKLLAGRAGRAAEAVAEAMGRLVEHVENLDGEVATCHEAIGEIDEATDRIAASLATWTDEIERVAEAAVQSSADIARVSDSTREVMAGVAQARVEADAVHAGTEALAGMAEGMRAPAGSGEAAA